MQKIGVLLVEDDRVWRTILTRFINNEQDMDVLQAVATKDDALSFCSRQNVDIVLMDINLSGNKLDGIQAILELSLMGSTAKVIALSSFDDEHVIIDTFTAGAIHYVTKKDFRKIPELIRSVFHSTSPQEVLVKEFTRLKEAEQYNHLTAAEKEIVLLYKKGYKRVQILELLGESESTIKNQISTILRKFKARSLKEVVRVIDSRGLNGKELDR